MKNRKYLIVFVTLSICAILNACREELQPVNEQQEAKITIQDGTVKNGRLYFPNKECLKEFYTDLKTMSDKDIVNYLDKNNFESLRPVITEENGREVIEKIKQRKVRFSENNSIEGKDNSAKLTTIDDDEALAELDDLEEIIGDDAYSAMLNGEAEIQVADKIYKYTDVGLFITPESTYNVLVNYLDVNSISRNLLEPTDVIVAQGFVESQPSDKLVSINKNHCCPIKQEAKLLAS